jgi:uncharacterized protein
LLAGEDLSDEALGQLRDSLVAADSDVQVETHRGDQPLYHVIMSAE